MVYGRQLTSQQPIDGSSANQNSEEIAPVVIDLGKVPAIDLDSKEKHAIKHFHRIIFKGTDSKKFKEKFKKLPASVLK